MNTFQLVKKQMLRALSSIFFFVGIPVVSFSSDTDSIPVKHAVRAAQYCQNLQYDLAVEAIEKAVADIAEKDELYTWYVKGFIYKEIYKNKESADRKSKSREIAVEAFLKSKQLAGEKADIYNNNSALKYLASTYYNDAIAMSGTFNTANELEPEELWDKYFGIYKAIGQEEKDKSEFLKVKGLRYYALWTEDICNITLNEKAFACLELSLDIASFDCDAYYNAGIVRYTLAQEILKNSPGGCLEGQDFNVTLQSSLELMLKAEKRCTANRDVMKALQNIYNALGDEEKTGYYQDKLKE